MPLTNEVRLVLQFVVGLFVAMAGGLAFCFSLLVPALKGAPFHYSERQIGTIAGTVSVAGFFSLPAGFAYDNLGGPRPSILIGAIITTVCWLLLARDVFWAQEDDFPQEEQGKMKQSLLFTVTALFSLVQLSNTFIEVAVMISAFDAFRLHHGFVIVTYKTCIGVGSSVISLLYAGFFSTEEESQKAPLAGQFCLFVGSFCAVVCMFGFFFTSVPPLTAASGGAAAGPQPPGAEWSFLARWWDIRVLGANTLPEITVVSPSSPLTPLSPTSAEEMKRMRAERQQQIQSRLDAQAAFRPVLSAGYKILFSALILVTIVNLLELAVGDKLPTAVQSLIACVLMSIPLAFLYLLRVIPNRSGAAGSGAGVVLAVPSSPAAAASGSGSRPTAGGGGHFLHAKKLSDDEHDDVGKNEDADDEGDDEGDDVEMMINTGSRTRPARIETTAAVEAEEVDQEDLGAAAGTSHHLPAAAAAEMRSGFAPTGGQPASPFGLAVRAVLGGGRNRNTSKTSSGADKKLSSQETFVRNIELLLLRGDEPQTQQQQQQQQQCKQFRPLYDLEDDYEEHVAMCREPLTYNLRHRPLDLFLLWLMCFGCWGSSSMISNNIASIYYSLQGDYTFSTARNAVFVSIFGIGNAVGRASSGLLLPVVQGRALERWHLLRAAPLTMILGLLLFVVARGAALMLPCFCTGWATGYAWGFFISIVKRCYAFSAQTYSFLYTAAICGVVFFVLFLFPTVYERSAEIEEAAERKQEQQQQHLFPARTSGVSQQPEMTTTTMVSLSNSNSTSSRYCNGLQCVGPSLAVAIAMNGLSMVSAELFIHRVNRGTVDSDLGPVRPQGSQVVEEFVVQ